MTHDIVFDCFRKQFPHLAKRLTAWFPNGKNSIRVRYKAEGDFIFTFNKEGDWSYETVDCFINRLKGVS